MSFLTGVAGGANGIVAATIDGRTLPDKTARLGELFLAPTGNGADVMCRVAHESERHHLAGGSFVVTNPWKVGAVLQARVQGRLRLELGDEAQDLGPGVRELRFTEAPLAAVTFARDARLGVMVPASMVTTWVDPDTKRPVEGLASYRNYRRFDVRTELNLPGPRQP